MSIREIVRTEQGAERDQRYNTRRRESERAGGKDRQESRVETD